MDQPRGARLTSDGADFSVWAPEAEALTLCLFEGERETQLPMLRDGELWHLSVPAIMPGQRYGFRAAGPWVPDHGLCFDPTKLLVDPWARAIDRPFVHDPRLGQRGVDTAAVVPKGVVTAALPDVPVEPPLFQRGGLIYELNVRGFTKSHPDVLDPLRGTIAALGHPSVIAHLKALHVSAVELMPIVAWIDERHLGAHGLSNAWGYNPVVPMALDPRLCPGGIAELRDAVAKLHAAGIGVILDLVFNHSCESDRAGATLSFRGLGERSYYALEPDGGLINDAGTGNILNFAVPEVRAMMLESLRRFVREAGVDGFRFDLAPILARGPGFDPNGPIFAELSADPWLHDRVMIAEPWDIGPGGYQLGNFPANWLEWNDRYRDDVRRFWRGGGSIGEVVTRIAGSSDIFGKICRSVNFLAAHDGFTLADTVSYAVKHNHANGEDGRDGHDENFSWNHGVEGPSDDAHVQALRDADIRAMLSTLFASTGTIMLTAGDEFGRSQQGNNNGYAQDNETTWIDWSARDVALEAFTAGLARPRATRGDLGADFPEPGRWTKADGADLTATDWEAPMTDYVRYEAPLAQGQRFILEIDRSTKRVIVDIVQN